MEYLYFIYCLLLFLGVQIFITTPTLNSYGARYFSWREQRNVALKYYLIGGLALGILVVFNMHINIITMLALSFVVAVLVAVTVVDNEFKLIPDRFHFLGFAGVLVYLLQTTAYKYILLNFLSSLTLTFLLVALNFAYTRLRHREGVGYGDIKLLFWASLLFGNGFLIIILSGFLACLLYLPYLLLRKNPPQIFAFGGVIATSVYLCLLLPSLLITLI